METRRSIHPLKFRISARSNKSINIQRKEQSLKQSQKNKSRLLKASLLVLRTRLGRDIKCNNYHKK